jgi:RNA polymerase sigma factor (sigma-70 family)
MDQTIGLEDLCYATKSSPPQSSFETDLLGILPQLRAFGRFLASNPAEADDLVQETVLRAIKSQCQFAPGTNLKAWTFTILRNLRINLHRARKYEPLDEHEFYALSVNANQQHSLELKDVLRVLAGLPPRYREIITLIRCSGLSYEEAAAVTGCKLGTIKSRLNRADSALRDALGTDFRAPRRTRSDVDKASSHPAELANFGGTGAIG